MHKITDYLVKEKRDGETLFYKPRFPIQAALTSFAEWQQGTHAAGKVLKTTGKSRVMIIPTTGIPSCSSLCIKEYAARQWSSRLKTAAGYSKAKIAWNNALRLKLRSIPTPEPFALVEQKRGLLSHWSLLISEDLSRFPRVDYYILDAYHHRAPSADLFVTKRRFIESFAAAIRSLHDKKIYLGDLKAPNILVERALQEWVFYFVDTDRVTFEQPVSLRRIVKNFAQLHTSIPWCMTRTDRLRFLVAYLGRDRFRMRYKKAIIRNVLRESSKRLAVHMTPIE
ncbi:MAG TPA: lipopolysaccharide kinase InaA family protein [Thermodesulfobacteriota bacterium]|nr:lipopolysaccharide kinase InaA family protein [Thermodesulfobacteriota bacterium]HNU72045.1 lipopolysaccharide kinase InaA family protein [Thermodesulfobacteriota bacterium]HQO78279.1 lipopolysaccharide kinase InaA family protein [Thermodesulfobacteriota bacterium]